MARTASKAPCDGRPGRSRLRDRGQRDVRGCWEPGSGGRARCDRGRKQRHRRKKRRRDTDLLRLLEDLEVRLDAPHAHGGFRLERELVGPQRVASRQHLPSFKPQVGAVEPLVLLGHLAQTLLAVISQLLAPFSEPSLDRVLRRPQPPPR